MALSSPDIDYLCAMVAEKSGNVITPRQAYMLEQQLKPLAVSEGLKGVEQLVGKLRQSPGKQLSQKVAEAVTVNETSFFRDMHPFETLRTTVLPDLIKANEAKKQLRIWCAASSSGQEPYSLAMVIREHFPNLKDWSVKILATDLSEEMLTKTRQGTYTQLEVNRGLPVKKLVRFFDRDGANWKVKPELRSLIDCRRLNLAEDWPYVGRFDMVFIRNVLIYFDQTTKAEILRRTVGVLNPNGYLFIGSTELVAGMNLPMKRESTNETVYYRPS